MSPGRIEARFFSMSLGGIAKACADHWPIVVAVFVSLGAVGAAYYFSAFGLFVLSIFNVADYFWFAILSISSILALAPALLVAFFFIARSTELERTFGDYPNIDPSPIAHLAPFFARPLFLLSMTIRLWPLWLLLWWATALVFHAMNIAQFWDLFPGVLGWRVPSGGSVWHTAFAFGVMAALFGILNFAGIPDKPEHPLTYSFIAALLVVVTMVGPAILTTLLPRPVYDVRIGENLAYSNAELVWGGDRALVLMCDGQPHVVYGPENVRVLPAADRSLNGCVTR